jgi:hypothetical protein
MTPQEVLALVQGLGLLVRAEGNNLFVSPVEKLTPELRSLLTQYKDELLDLLAPQHFGNLRSALQRLEKEVGIEGPEPEVIAVKVMKSKSLYTCGREHTENEIETLRRHAIEKARLQPYEKDVILALLIGGVGSCDICRLTPEA